MNDLLSGSTPCFSINPADYVDLAKDIEMGHGDGDGDAMGAKKEEEEKKKKQKKKKKKKRWGGGNKVNVKPNQTTDHSLSLFFGEVDAVKMEMEKVRELLARLQAGHEETRKAHRAEAMKGIRRRMEEDVGEVLAKVKSMKGKLEKMEGRKKKKKEGDWEGEGEEEEEEDGYGIGNPSYGECGQAMERARCAIVGSLRKKLRDLMQEFQEVREKMQREHREDLRRRIYAVTGEMPEEPWIESMMEAGESESFVARVIQEQGKEMMDLQGRHAIEAVVAEIEDRHGSVKEMGRSLLELHQLFLDMAVLVESQGEHLDCIEHHVSLASAYVDHGTQQLVSAKKSHSHSRRWTVVIIIVALLVIIALVLVPVVTSFKSS